MKLEVGMYARTINGKILKINRYDEQPDNPLWMTINSGIMSKGSISQASYEIIDLIQVGDYVNGNRIDQIDKFKDGSVYLQFGDAGQYYCKNYSIKSIVTKEQFESISYKVD